MNTAATAALAKLLAASGDLPESALTPSQRRALDELSRQTGALHRVPAGRGAVYRVRHRELLQGHLTAMRPIASEDLSSDLHTRAANIGTTRDSKGRSHRHEQCYLLTKAIGDGVVWQRSNQEFDLSSATRASGAGALALTATDDWQTSSPLWLIENQAVFDRLDWFPDPPPATVAYYAGQLPGEVLRWLGHAPRARRVVLFADYDGTGLMNFARLHQATHGRCEFWLMPNWPELLHRFGNRDLWQRTRPDYERALKALEGLGYDHPIKRLVAAMAGEGAALEHEAVWLST